MLEKEPKDRIDTAVTTSLAPDGQSGNETRFVERWVRAREVRLKRDRIPSRSRFQSRWPTPQTFQTWTNGSFAMPSSSKIDTHHKALTLNLDPTTFGSLAEIGAA